MVLIPQIDIEKVHGAIVQIASMSPSRKMFQILLQSVDLMMDDLVEARESLSGSSVAVDNALEKWDTAFMEFGVREAWYSNILETSQDPDEIKLKVGDPLLRGRFPSGTPHPPNWPDLETPWRLMNDIAGTAAMAGKSQSFLDDLEGRWKDNFSRYWKTNALRLSMHAKNIEGDGGVAAPEGEGMTFSATLGGEAQNYRQAAESSASFAQKADDFFSRENWEKFKTKAKSVGIGMVVGAALAILIVVRVRA